MQLTEKAKQLIPKARIVSFQTWQGIYPDEAIAIWQKADDEGRYLTDEDIEALMALVPSLASSFVIVQFLREQAAEIVNLSREQVLLQYPHITEPGGELYPPVRAESCWRDFWHFLRCITYGIAGQSTAYTSIDGLKYMQELYQELKVPLPAMILGLEQLKFFSLAKMESKKSLDLAPYFDCLIEKLKLFNY